jgi:4-amino-4-deoxy-L-arabinose transferase-like glycosyltransferase
MRSGWLLAAIASLLFFCNLGGAHLWDEDEAIFSQTAREMYDRGEAVVPYFNGQLFAHKPPLMYWFMAAGYGLFGTGEFAARCFSAVFGVGSVLLTYRLGRLIFSPTAGFWAGLVLATSLNFNVIARAATPDAFLVFFCTLSILFFVSGTAKARAVSADASERNAPWAGQTAFEPSWTTYTLVYGAMGLAVLTKGPIGVVLPTAVLGLFLLVMRAPAGSPGRDQSKRGTSSGALRVVSHWLARVLLPRHVLATIWSMRPLTAIVTVLAVAGPWYLAVGLKTDGEFLSGFFGVHNLGRFLNAMENHRGPVFYYLIAMAAGFFPWSVLFGPMMVDVRRLLNGPTPWRAGYVLAISWVVVWVGFFSLAGTKLPSYILPAYPGLALICGALVDRWLRDASVIAKGWTRAVWATVALVGIGMIVALPIAARWYLADTWLLASLGLIPLGGAAIGCFFTEHGRARPAAVTLAAMSVALMLGVFAVGAAYVDRYRDTPHFAEIVTRQADAQREVNVASYHYFRPSFVFYTGRSVAQAESPDDVRRFFASHPEAAFVLTTDEGYELLSSSLPRDVTVVATHRRFLRRGNAVLLGRTPQARAAAAEAPDAPRVQ